MWRICRSVLWSRSFCSWLVVLSYLHFALVQVCLIWLVMLSYILVMLSYIHSRHFPFVLYFTTQRPEFYISILKRAVQKILAADNYVRTALGGKSSP